MRKTLKEKLMEAQKIIIALNNKPIDGNRKELVKAIEKLTADYNFVRIDKDKTVQLHLYNIDEMAPEITIGVDSNKNIWISDDPLWGTIFGIEEQEEERRAYGRDY